MELTSLGQVQTGQWGIYTTDGNAAVPFRSFYGLTRKAEGKVTTHPTEPNGFFAYNKLDAPDRVSVILAVDGGTRQIEATLSALEDLKTGIDKVDVITPEKTLTGYSLEAYDYQRDSSSGVDRLLVVLSLVEIREVQPEYSNETIPAPKRASDGKTQNAGKQSAQSADSATEGRARKKSRLAAIFK